MAEHGEKCGEPSNIVANRNSISFFKIVVITLLLCNLLFSIILYSELQELQVISEQQSEQINEFGEKIANLTRYINETQQRTNDNDGSSPSEKLAFIDKLYFAECFHGGLLMSGNGSDWQFSAYETFDRLFNALEENTEYKVTLELEPSMLQHYDPYYLSKLKEFINSGQIEIALTGYNQEFLGNFTYTYALYSLNMSLKAIQKYLNYTPTVFLAQEQAFRIDTPKLLNKLGIKYTLGKVQMDYWGEIIYRSGSSDLVTWCYEEGGEDYSIIMIPDNEIYYWGNVDELISTQHKQGVHHPFISQVRDLEIQRSKEYYFPFHRSDNSRFQYVLLSEYIENIAYEPKEDIEISADSIILVLPDSTNYVNYDGVEMNKTQFEIIITKTHELGLIWLDINSNNNSEEIIIDLFERISRLGFHDIWVCYNYCFGMCETEGFENWFDYWQYYYDATVEYLQSEGLLGAFYG